MSETGEVVTQEPLAAPEPAGNATPRAGTDYVILSLDEEMVGGDSLVGKVWRVQMESLTAASADAAIRSFTDPDEQAGTFVAVPVRSFQPRTVVAEKSTVMRFA